MCDKFEDDNAKQDCYDTNKSIENQCRELIAAEDFCDDRTYDYLALRIVEMYSISILLKIIKRTGVEHIIIELLKKYHWTLPSSFSIVDDIYTSELNKILAGEEY